MRPQAHKRATLDTHKIAHALLLLFFDFAAVFSLSRALSRPSSRRSSRPGAPVGADPPVSGDAATAAPFDVETEWHPSSAAT